MEETKQRLAALPAGTIVFHLHINVDGAGQFFIPREALAKLSTLSNAPIFGVSETYLGFGIAGGPCIRFVGLGREVADQTVAIIRSGEAEATPMIQKTSHRLHFDWRETQRHGLEAARVPAVSEDALLCDRMARHAVHAAMAGKTGLVISYLNGQFCHVAIRVIAQGSKHLDPDGKLWREVLSSTWQPQRLM
jgi:hypothetical protein